MRRGRARTARLAAALALAAPVAALGACTGAAEAERQAAALDAPRPATSSRAPSPTASPVAESVLQAPSGRRYVFRTSSDRIDVTLTGGRDEPGLAESFGMPGGFVAPQVVPGGPVDGLSPDGRWLVLEGHPTASRARSTFVVLTGLLRMGRETFSLPGRFTFDAWSTRGDVLYLVEHQPPEGSGNYQVRAYDMRTRSLRPEPVADKREIGEQMAGRPLARAANPSGAVVATLYVKHEDGDEPEAFVHLLYVDEGSALCVDLPHGTVVDQGWSLQHVGSGFVLSSGPGRAAFRIDATSGELTPAS